MDGNTTSPPPSLQIQGGEKQHTLDGSTPIGVNTAPLLPTQQTSTDSAAIRCLTKCLKGLPLWQSSQLQLQYYWDRLLTSYISLYKLEIIKARTILLQLKTRQPAHINKVTLA